MTSDLAARARRLEKVRRVQALRRDLALMRFARADTAFRATDQQVQTLQTFQRTAEDAYRQGIAPWGTMYSAALEPHRHEATRLRTQQAHAREAALGDLRRAERRHAGVERLVAHRIAAWREEVAREDRKVLDEMGITRHLRRGLGTSPGIDLPSVPRMAPRAFVGQADGDHDSC